MSNIVHIWKEFFPGQFIEPHRYLLEQPEWRSRVIAAEGINTETSDMPGLSCFTTWSLERWRTPTQWGRAVARLTQPLFWNRYNRFCSEHLKQFRPDIIHAHFGTTAVRVLPALEARLEPLIVTFYGVDASAALQDPRWAEGFRRLFRRSTRVIGLCESVRQRLIEAGCPSEKVRVWNLPAGIEQYPFSPRRPGKTTRFLMAARFIEKKGHPYLLTAFKALLERGREATLTLMGYGSQRPALERQVGSMGLSSRVLVVDTEARRDFPKVYRPALENHDIFVLPSTTAANGDDEGGPALTMVCAQAAGLPVVCTPFPGSEITLVDGVTGLYCAQDDANSLRQKLECLIDQPERWTAMGRAGSDLVAREFSEAGQVEKLLGIYRETACSTR